MSLTPCMMQPGQERRAWVPSPGLCVKGTSLLCFDWHREQQRMQWWVPVLMTLLVDMEYLSPSQRILAGFLQCHPMGKPSESQTPRTLATLAAGGRERVGSTGSWHLAKGENGAVGPGLLHSAPCSWVCISLLCLQ